MPLMYSASLGGAAGVTVGSDSTQDLLSIEAAASTEIILYGWEVTSDAVAATLLECALIRISATGSGGGTPTATRLHEQTAASSAILGEADTTSGAPIANEEIATYQWEQLGPLGQIYIPEMRIRIDAGDGIALVCNTAAAFEMGGYIVWEELG